MFNLVIASKCALSKNARFVITSFPRIILTILMTKVNTLADIGIRYI